jgi:hypothetical protein
VRAVRPVHGAGRFRRLSSSRQSAFFPPVVTEQLVPSVWVDEWSPMKPFLLA